MYHQSVQIRKNGITLRGSGAFHGGTVLVPPKHVPKTLCNRGFGPTGVCILAKRVDPKTGAVFTPVRRCTVTGLLVTGFPGNGVFGYGTVGLKVTRVVADQRRRLRHLALRILEDRVRRRHRDRQRRGRVLRRDSPHADTVVRNDQAFGNQFGIFIRHARHVLVSGNVVNGNCQGILVLDDGQRGGAGNAVIRHNRVFDNNKFCKKNEDTPVTTKGGGILLLGATHTQVTHNSVTGNAGRKFNSGGIVVLSAKPLTHGSNPEVRHDLVQLRFRQPSRGPDLGPHWNRRAVQAQRLRERQSRAGSATDLTLATSAPGAARPGR